MSSKFFKDSLSNETLINLTDEMLKYEKANQSDKKYKFEFLKVLSAAAAIALVIGLINILPVFSGFGFGVFSSGGFRTDGTIVDIYAGSAAFGAIDSEGNVYMWGDNTFGQCDVPKNLPPIKDMGIGAHCVIALGVDGKLYGWGTNEYNAMDFIGTEGTFIDVDANSYHTAAVSSDGKVYKWSTANQGGQKSVPLDLPPIVSVQCNIYSTTAMDAEGNVYTWPKRSQNEILDGVKAQMAAPLAYDTVVLGKDGKIYGDIAHENLNSKFKAQPDIKNIKSIYGGPSNVAAIDGDGNVYIWGEYDYNAGEPSIVDVPENLPPMAKIAFGYDTVIGLGENGYVYQWNGNIWNGTNTIQCGDNVTFQFERPLPPDHINGFLNDTRKYAPKNEKPYKYGESVTVTNSEEFARALQNKASKIYVDGVVDLTAQSVNILDNQEIHILPNGVLNVKTANFFVRGDIINDGIINVSGRMLLFKEPIEISVINTLQGGETSYYRSSISVDEMKRILSGDSPFTSISVVTWEPLAFVIDEDYTLPENKSLWLNGYTTLKIAQGVIFTVNGNVTTFNAIINEGEIINGGNINEYLERNNG